MIETIKVKIGKYTLPFMINRVAGKVIALIDVDIMKTFSELCPDELPVEGALEIVSPINILAKAMNYRIGTKDAHSDQGDWITDKEHEIGSDHPNPHAPHKWKQHGVIATFGFEMLDGMPEPLEYDHFIWKGMESNLHPYGACYHDPLRTLSTGLIEWLLIHGVTEVVVVGLAYDYCVATTAEELADCGAFDVVMIKECARGINPDGYSAVEDKLNKKGVIIFDTVDDYFKKNEEV